MSFRVVPVLLALALLPTSAATWYAYGTHEPDNGLDDPTFARFDPPGAARNLVYFNAYTSINDMANPNVGALGTRIEPVGLENHLAIFGRWVDCNQDGYVGMAETAVREYDARLLLDDDLCPATGGPAAQWNGEPNYRGWVTELVPIAGRGARLSGDARLFRDNDAMVWGDYGTPEYAFSHVTCPLRPLPTGTTRSTGGFLDYADCRVSQMLGDENDLATNYNGALGLLGNPANLMLPDDEDWTPASAHPLNQPTFGSSSSEETIVKVQDCDEAYIYNWGDLPNAANDLDGQGIRSPGLNTDDINPFGTVPGTVNYTFESAPLPDQTGSSNSADCNATDDDSDEFYSGLGNLEGEHPGIPTNPKTKAHFNFNLTVTTRGGAPLGVVVTGASGASSDGGLEPFESVCTICDATEWAADWGPFKPSVQLVKGNLFQGDISIATAYYVTYYAKVGSATLDKGLAITSGNGVYGAATCGDNNAGIHNGWNCDAAAWNFNLDGSPMNEFQPLARVGMSYQFRDVDCYDGALGQTGVYANPSGYGEHPCLPVG